MKKFFKIFLLIICLTLAGFGGYYIYLSWKASDVEKIIPEGAFIYSKTTDVSRIAKDIWTSPFVDILINDIDYAMLADNPEQVNAYVALLRQFNKELANPAVQLFLKKFFGTELAVAVYPASVGNLGDENVMDIISNIFLVTKLEPEAQFIELMTGFLKKAGAEIAIDTEVYRGKKITNIDFFELGFGVRKFSYVRVGNYLVGGLTSKAARAAVDVLKGKREPFSNDLNFLKLKDRYLENANNISFMNSKVFFEILRDNVMKTAKKESKGDPSAMKQVEEVYARMTGIKGVGYSMQYGPTIKIKSDIIFNRKELDPQIRKVYSCKPKTNQSLKFIPKDIVYYQWVDCNDWNSYWDKILEEIDNDPQKEMAYQGIAGIESLIKLKIEDDIIAAFGQDIGWFITDVNFDGAFPVPNSVFFIKIQDTEKAQKIISKFSEQPLIAFQPDEYHDVRINYFTVPLKVELKPGYCILGDYLFFATDYELLKKVVDVGNGMAAPLSESVGFKSVNFGLSEANNSILFVEGKLLLQKIRGVVRWLSEWALEKHKQNEAYKKGSIARLDNLKQDAQRLEGRRDNIKEELKELELDKRKAEVKGIEERLPELNDRIAERRMRLDMQEQALDLANTRVDEQQKVVNGFAARRSINPKRSQMVLNQFLLPLLHGFETFEYIGSNMKFQEDSIETNLYIKTGE